VEDVLGDWRRPGFDLELDGVLVLDAEGAIVGNGEVFAARAEGNVLPEHEGRGVGAWIAAWIERRARAAGYEFVRQVAPASATRRLELLRAAGYEVSDTAWELRIALDQVGVRPPLPEGLEVRDLRPGIDDEAAWRVIEDAFSP
jgi:GNAT superfamily N-acetyltransferase